MARPLRIECYGALYHIALGGNARKAIYRDDDDRLHKALCLPQQSDKKLLQGNYAEG
jgi:hypothetical protein